AGVLSPREVGRVPDREGVRDADPNDPRGAAREVLFRPHRDPGLGGRARLGLPARLRRAHGLPGVPAGALGRPVAPPSERDRPRTLDQALRPEVTVVTRERTGTALGRRAPTSMRTQAAIAVRNPYPMEIAASLPGACWLNWYAATYSSPA